VISYLKLIVLDKYISGKIGIKKKYIPQDWLLQSNICPQKMKNKLNDKNRKDLLYTFNLWLAFQIRFTISILAFYSFTPLVLCYYYVIKTTLSMKYYNL